jgi:RHS repeat-associated protein
VTAEYSFDAWGRRRDKDDWSYTLAGDAELIGDRGFTGHEWLPWFNLYNMNGRLYDPVVGRFLSPDNYVQMPDFSQNFNRYSYALNNPLKYNDPDGEIIFTLLAALIPGAQPLLPYAIAADIGWMTDYGMQVAMNYANKQEGWTGKDIWFKQIDWFDVGMSAVVSGATGGFGAELKAGKELGKFGSWVVKNSKLIYAGEIIATSAIDITGEGWQKVGMDDFGKRVAIGLTIYGINDIVGDYTKKWANVDDAMVVTPDGVVLPEGAYIPKEFVENPFRKGSYGIMENGKFIEKLRIDPGTLPGIKGPNSSHFHLNGGKKHIFDLNKWPWWKNKY